MDASLWGIAGFVIQSDRQQKAFEAQKKGPTQITFVNATTGETLSLPPFEEEN